ncbi:MAG: A/G-specific adenine glycosylase [Phycisphaerales bacterium]|nr:A/G-specific adenine glycosylase [Phycisphaerales bacterium]
MDAFRLRRYMHRMTSEQDQAWVRRFRRALLAWYDRHRRDLPWRLDPPIAYATLVSEFMLQQTQVATVIPYFERFMRRFPTVHSLARARIGSVLPYWAGLGYYRRCHHLHAAARTIVREHGGCVPQDVDSLRSLPGVGAYTAGAVASIAFGVRAPAVDGNVRRVLARVTGAPHRTISTSAGRTGSARPAADRAAEVRPAADMFVALAGRLVPPTRPGDFNQALMELGATVCSPGRPHCASCPVTRLCAFGMAQARGEAPARSAALSARCDQSHGLTRDRSQRLNSDAVGRVRVHPAFRKPRPMHLVSLVVQREGLFLYVQRPVEGLWAGLWEWPTSEVPDGMSPRACAAKLARELLGPDARGLSILGRVGHQLTHRAVTIHVFEVETDNALRTPRRRTRATANGDSSVQHPSRGGRWRALDELPARRARQAALPMSAAQRKVQALWLRHASTQESRQA